MFILIVLNLIEHKNKPEHLPIDTKGVILILVNFRYLFIFILNFLFLDNNLIVYTKLERRFAFFQI